MTNNDSNGSQATPDYLLLVAGIFLLLIPLVFMVIVPALHDKAEFYLRVIAALGGALVGASLPGILHVKLPFARAGGALAVFLLIYAVNPAQITMQKLSALAEDAPIVTPSNSDASESVELAKAENSSLSDRTTQPITEGVLKKGWIYIGHRPDDEWQYRSIEIDGKAELKSGAEYVVTKKLKVRDNAPRLSITGYKFGDVKDILDPDQMVRITSNIDEVGLSKVWAEIEYTEQ